MEEAKLRKRVGIAPFGWLMICLCLLLALGLVILVYGLMNPPASLTYII